jgi:hypothetical protein
MFHHLIWQSHAGFLYVDDFLFFMEANMMPISATMLCIFCQLLGIPISWKKTALNSCIDYWLAIQFSHWHCHYLHGQDHQTARLYFALVISTSYEQKISGEIKWTGHVDHTAFSSHAYLDSPLVSRPLCNPSDTF